MGQFLARNAKLIIGLILFAVFVFGGIHYVETALTAEEVIIE